MARPRKQFCPQGHDKDAPNGSILVWQKSANGTKIRARRCRACYNLYKSKWQKKRRVENAALKRGSILSITNTSGSIQSA